MNESEQARFDAELEQGGNQEVQEMVLTLDEALAESRAEGEARGIAEGEAMAAREAVARVLEHRWSAVPSSVLEKLDTIEDPARLQDLLTQTLEARSIDDLAW